MDRTMTAGPADPMGASLSHLFVSVHDLGATRPFSPL